jgi:hypothetical protein
MPEEKNIQVFSPDEKLELKKMMLSVQNIVERMGLASSDRLTSLIRLSDQIKIVSDWARQTDVYQDAMSQVFEFLEIKKGEEPNIEKRILKIWNHFITKCSLGNPKFLVLTVIILFPALYFSIQEYQSKNK